MENKGISCNHVSFKKILIMISLIAAEQKICASSSEKPTLESSSAVISQDPRCAKIAAMLNAAVEDGRKKWDGIGKNSTSSVNVDQSVAPLCHHAWAAVKQPEGVRILESGNKDGMMHATVSVPVVKEPVKKTAQGLLSNVYAMIGWGQ